MARVEFESFGEDEVSRIYMAGRLREAQGVEEVLSTHDIDYYPEVEIYVTYLLGVVPRRQKGVAFYVRASEAAQCKHLLRDSGMGAGILEEEYQ